MFVVRLRNGVWIVDTAEATNWLRRLQASTLEPGEGNIMNFGPFLLNTAVLLVAWAGGFLMFHTPAV